MCLVDRLAGEKGFCGLSKAATLARILPHFGEEPPICGEEGAATFFFSGCTMRCSFCQNWQISRKAQAGSPYSAHELAKKMFELEKMGCSHLDFVSPTPHLPWLLEALAEARANGCTLPTVVNTNGYLPPEVVEIYREACDIILFDLKFAIGKSAKELSRTDDYVGVSQRAARLALSLFGPLVVNDDGMATQGMIVRHLVLPNHLTETKAVLEFVASLPPPLPTLSLMAQYHPAGGAPERLPLPLQNPLSQEEYFQAIDVAAALGLDDLIFQESGCGTHFLPDFKKEKPFQ